MRVYSKFQAINKITCALKMPAWAENKLLKTYKASGSLTLITFAKTFKSYTRC